MTPKQKAEELYNSFYQIIFEFGEELSQEIIISTLAKKCAIRAAKEIYPGNDSNIYFYHVVKYLEKM